MQCEVMPKTMSASSVWVNSKIDEVGKTAWLAGETATFLTEPNKQLL